MRGRHFVALELDEGARASCAAVAQRIAENGWTGRWVPPADYHLTVAFLGTLEDAQFDAVFQALRHAAAAHARFAMVLDAVGAFPAAECPRVAWVGPAGPVPAFVALCVTTRAALGRLGFYFDADAVAHVTLARSAGSAPLPAVSAEPIVVRADAITLFRSQRDAPLHYEPVEHFPLRE